MSLTGIIIGFLFFFLCIFIALIILGFKKGQPETPTQTDSTQETLIPVSTAPAAETPINKPSTPAASDTGILEKIKKIPPRKLKIAVIILFGALLILSVILGSSPNPYSNIVESKNFAYDANITGVVTQESRGSDWINFTAGKGGVKGELCFLSVIRPGDCAKTAFRADKKGGKIKMLFRPLNEASPALKTEEIPVEESEGSTFLCYEKEAMGARAEAIVSFDAPEGVTTTIKIE